MICNVCGAQNEENTAFCTQCGSPLKNDQAFEPAYQPMEDHPTELFNEAAPEYDAAPAYDATPAYDAAPAYDSAEPIYQPDGTTPEATDPGAGLGKTSKILGIFGIISSCCGFGLVLSIVALILGNIGQKKSAEAGLENASAKTGKTLGIVGIVIGAIVCVISFIATTVLTASGY